MYNINSVDVLTGLFMVVVISSMALMGLFTVRELAKRIKNSFKTKISKYGENKEARRRAA